MSDPVAPNQHSPQTQHDRWECQQLGHELAVYDSISGDVHLLNRTAGQIWKMMREGVDTEGIVLHLSREYPAIGSEQLAHDLALTVRQLKDLGLTG